MPRIAVVVLDTLRKDSFDQHFDWLPGTRFENAWSTSHYTVPAHGSLLTGRYPSETGVNARSEDFDYPHPSLPELLQEAGFTTRAFSENFLFSPLNSFDRGFSSFVTGGRATVLDSEIFPWKETISELSGSGISRDLKAINKCILSEYATLSSLRYGWKLKRDNFDGTKEAIEFVNNAEFGDDEFVFFNLMQAHLPYDPPASHRSVDPVSRDPESEANTILAGDVDLTIERQLYDDCARYLSEIYEVLFESLSNSFDYIFTLSDHGELFGEHGAIKHWYGVYPELTHVPMVLYDGDDEIETNKNLVSILDIHQTILDIVGIEHDSRGNDLREDTERDVCLTEFNGLRDERIERLQNRNISLDVINKYDRDQHGIALSPDNYGYETPNGFRQRGSCPPDDLQDRLQSVISSLDKRGSTDERKSYSDDLMNHLKDLGYA
ncbi:sulfatase-like hydrolase/transferase [Halobacterium salinarum]|uniref:sulfatase-like hydrolase/transferase n=1 Tax=Halobacterium salinarum TaxID=2242 RepID=UPI0025534274|nr:sulfatase-like hydrolase/transferase [Halobacterium salinarum]MDL0126513.1 sulfatase-like hydrolase/transferase [Halobacterium salinarum]